MPCTSSRTFSESRTASSSSTMKTLVRVVGLTASIWSLSPEIATRRADLHQLGRCPGLVLRRHERLKQPLFDVRRQPWPAGSNADLDHAALRRFGCDDDLARHKRWL